MDMESVPGELGPDEVQPELMSSLDASKYLGISLNTLTKWRSRNIGPKYYKYGGANNAAVRYDRDDVEEFRLAHGVRTTGGDK
jgi:hypothetical protein